MTNQDLIVIFSTAVIASSGIFINWIKRGDQPQNKTKDNNTLLWFRVLVPFALVLSIAFYFFKIGKTEYSNTIINCGAVLVVVGLLIRWYSIWYIGNAFTVQVKIIENHQLITTNIYKNIRHPSYTGLLIYYLGLGLVTENIISIFLLVLFPLIAVICRINWEEQVLTAHFKDKYSAYQKRSWRLIPWIY